ncbi:hypothetical protein Droror1_Dr00009147 [Drosera rotundifolia]
MAEKNPWPWRKKSSDRINVVVVEKEDSISKRNDEEIHKLLLEKTELERDVEDLSDRLSAAIAECDAKDELATRHAKTAQEALTGWEKAETRAMSLKQELNKAVQDRLSSEERASKLDAALKECMQQLHFVREQQEHRIHDALTRALQDFDNARLVLEEKLGESSKKIAKLGMENDQLSRVLLQKEQLIEQLKQQVMKADNDTSAFLDRLESMERDNNSLKYEVRLLEKELDIRNEEREVAQKTAEAAHKQHLENVRKIARLESECQRLRVLVKKRLPGPAALAKMKNEVEMLERIPSDNRRRRQNGNPSNLRPEYAGEPNPQDPNRKINLLIAKLCLLEEENNALRESLQRKTDELQGSRNLYAQATARLFQAESRLEGTSPKCQNFKGLTQHNNVSCQQSSTTISDDIRSDAESWASALVTELEHFRDGKPRGGSSSCRSNAASEASLMDDFVEMEKMALVFVDNPAGDSVHATFITKLDGSSSGSTEKASNNTTESTKERKTSSQHRSSESMTASCRLPETPTSLEDLETASGNVGHTFQAKTSELDTVLQGFLHTCDDLFKGKVHYRTFVQELTSTLEWIINQCLPLKDLSSLKDASRKLLDWVEKQESALEHRVEHEKNIEITEEESAHTLDDPIHESNTSSHHPHKAETNADTSQAEAEGLEPDKVKIEDQTEYHSIETEASESQLSTAVVGLDETHAKLSSLEEEAEVQSEICEVLQGRCHELQFQLESVTNMKDDKKLGNEDEKQLRTDQEILSASERLAQCQETILNLGKQLKAFASPNDAMLFDKMSSNPTSKAPTTEPTQQHKKKDRRSSLLDKMLADNDDDDAGAEGDQFESPKSKVIECDSDAHRTPTVQNGSKESGSELTRYKEVNDSNNRMQQFINSPGVSLAIVPSKQKNEGFFKKLLWKRKKGNSKKPPFPFPS